MGGGDFSIAILTAVLFTFVSCSGGTTYVGSSGDDSSSKSVSAVFVAEYDDGDPQFDERKLKDTMTFYGDGTWSLHKSGYKRVQIPKQSKVFTVTVYSDFTIHEGTYTGNPSSDGKITANITEMYDSAGYDKWFQEYKTGAEAAYYDPQTFSYESSVFTNEYAPLKATSVESFIMTVSGGKIDDDGLVYTRQ